MPGTSMQEFYKHIVPTELKNGKPLTMTDTAANVLCAFGVDSYESVSVIRNFTINVPAEKYFNLTKNANCSII